MPLYEDEKYQALYIGDFHPVKLMDGNDVIFEPKLLELSGTSVSVDNTYNDESYVKINGKSQQTVTVQGTNLAGYNNLVIGAEYNSGALFPASITSYSYSNSVLQWLSTYGYRGIGFKFKAQAGLPYYASFVNVSLINQRNSINWYDINGAYINSANRIDANYVNGTAPANVSYGVFFASSRESGTCSISNIMIVQDSVSRTYTPFIPNSPSDKYRPPFTSSENFNLISRTPNLIQNGNFANGTTGWNYNACTISAENNILSCLGTGASGNFSAYQQTALSSVVGRKTYIRATMRVTSIISRYITIYTYNGVTVKYTPAIQNPVPNQWYTISGVVTQTDVGNSDITLLIKTYDDYSDSTYGKVMEIKEVMAIDMGIDSSNPLYNLTAAQMDAKFPNWIDYKLNSVNIAQTIGDLPDGTGDYIIIDNAKKEAWYQPVLNRATLSAGNSWTISDAKSGSAFRCTAIMPGYLSGNVLTSPEQITSNFDVLYELAVKPNLIPLDYNTYKCLSYYPHTNIYTDAAVQPMMDVKIRTIDI